MCFDRPLIIATIISTKKIFSKHVGWRLQRYFCYPARKGRNLLLGAIYLFRSRAFLLYFKELCSKYLNKIKRKMSTHAEFSGFFIAGGHEEWVMRKGYDFFGNFADVCGWFFGRRGYFLTQWMSTRIKANLSFQFCVIFLIFFFYLLATMLPS